MKRGMKNLRVLFMCVLILWGCSENSELEQKIDKATQEAKELQAKIDYSTHVLVVTLPLANSYVELNNLYTNQDAYGVDWLFMFEKHTDKLNIAYETLSDLTPPKEFENFHDTYLEILGDTIQVTDLTLELYNKGVEIPSKVKTQFEDVANQFTLENQQLDALKDYADILNN